MKYVFISCPFIVSWLSDVASDVRTFAKLKSILERLSEAEFDVGRNDLKRAVLRYTDLKLLAQNDLLKLESVLLGKITIEDLFVDKMSRE